MPLPLAETERTPNGIALFEDQTEYPVGLTRREIYLAIEAVQRQIGKCVRSSNIAVYRGINEKLARVLKGRFK